MAMLAVGVVGMLLIDHPPEEVVVVE